MDEENEEEESTQVAPPSSRPARRQRRDSTPIAEVEAEVDESQTQVPEDGNLALQTMVKNLVRLALASEHSRVPIRRADISHKVLGSHGRQFRAVFDAAQLALRQTFGMELIELPAREKISLKDRRAAQKSQASQGGGSNNASSKSWVLRTTLPERFRIPAILVPSRAPTSKIEAEYTGLYSFVVAIIHLAGGTIPEPKLERYLKRVNADQATPVDKTDKLLARMIKEGYIFKNRVSNSGEDGFDYTLSPRAKVEINEEGTAGLVRAVYGGADEDLERRLERSFRASRALNAPAAEPDAEGSRKKTRGRPRAGAREEQEAENDEPGDNENE